LENTNTAVNVAAEHDKTRVEVFSGGAPHWSVHARLIFEAARTAEDPSVQTTMHRKWLVIGS
jgi:hypothetical protein